MKNYVFDGEDKFSDEPKDDEDKDISGDDDLVDGFDKDDEVSEECAECGVAVTAEKKVVKTIEGEEYIFCSNDCAKEFEESLGGEEEEEEEEGI